MKYQVTWTVNGQTKTSICHTLANAERIAEYASQKYRSAFVMVEPIVNIAECDGRPRVKYRLPSGEVVRKVHDFEQMIHPSMNCELKDGRIVEMLLVNPALAWTRAASEP